MRSLAHLADHVLLHDLKSLVTRERGTTAELLAHLAEAEERRLHLPAAYPSMHAYCVNELGMSGDEALKRIRAARAARRFPSVLQAIADGRLHLSAVVLLAPHLTGESVDDLISASAHRTKSEVAVMVAARFPSTEVRTSLRAASTDQVVPEPVEFSRNPEVEVPAEPRADILATESSDSPPPSPAAPQPSRFELRATLDRESHDLLQYARSLLGHAIPSGDLALMLRRALTQLVEREEKRLFAACCRTRPRRGAPKGRYVPAEVRREVWLRDGGRCAFTSGSGTRCPSRTRIEFDHVTPVSKGGESTTANLRLCCRAHNQFEAERALGAGFMAGKREQSRRMRAKRKATTIAGSSTRVSEDATAPGATESSASPAPGQVDFSARRAELIPFLRKLGMRVDEAKRGAALCDALAEAPLERRVKFALGSLARERYRLPARET